MISVSASAAWCWEEGFRGGLSRAISIILKRLGKDHTSQVLPDLAMTKVPGLSLGQFLLLEPGLLYLEMAGYTHTRQRLWVASLEQGNPRGARLMSLS